MVNKIFPIAFVLYAIFTILGFVLHYKFLVYLKNKHAKKWQELGAPTLFINNSMKNNFAVLKFLKNKEYIKLNDSQLSKMSVTLRYFHIFGLISFVILTILCIIYIINNPKPGYPG
jgi:hypothetical protein